MEKGFLSLVLHAHLPYVRHVEREDLLEERWLLEALSECYIPLLQVFQGLIRDGVDFRLTMSISPTLLSMLSDPLLQERYLQHLNRTIELAEKEIVRTQGTAENALAIHYSNRFKEVRDFYFQYNGNLIHAFAQLQEAGKLELITSAATHAFLPLILTEEAIRAQIQTAVDLYERHFGRRPQGIWLPECGYTQTVDRLLQESGITYFFTDAHGVTTATPSPVFGTLSPVLTPHGVAAFPRDTESSQQVWSSREGYPGDFDYREYYRDIGFDLDMDTIGPYIHSDGIRVNTGIKYHRITGQGDQKELYDPEAAREKAAEHAGNFMFNREKQVEYWAEQMGRRPILTATYDAELFGHWWYEGPIWIDMLLRKIHFDQQTIKTITPSEYLALYSDYQGCDLPVSTWGRNGYADVWLQPDNDWIYPALHLTEQRMQELADLYSEPTNAHRDSPAIGEALHLTAREPTQLEERALNQAARELMLAQASDWAFIMDSKTMVDYAVRRTKHHINRFSRLYEMIQNEAVDEQWLSLVEQLDPIFPDMNYRIYQSDSSIKKLSFSSEQPRVLLLSWEFPPMTVGGLSRHVYDLSRHLALQGWDVHVVTTEVGEYPHYEVIEGVHVHRVSVVKPDGGEFIHWAFQLNLAMIDRCQQLFDSGLTFDILHAHDWLVTQAAAAIKKMYGLPLVATIHATEHGRNNGIYTDLQRTIHHLEWQLTYEAQRVIVCSTYMRQEVETLFQLPAEKVDVIPNGVDPKLLKAQIYTTASKEPYAQEQERIVLFVGRLVREKGVHTLLQAVPQILHEHPNVKFVIAGQGPAAEELERLAPELGSRDKVLFTGFISDEERNRLYQLAEVAVFPSLYEPFGIVALEAMMAGTPVAVSDVGGLSDVVEHEWNGLKMYPGDVNSLALQVNRLLQNSEWAFSMALTASKELTKYDWNQIARQTIDVFEGELRQTNESCNHGRGKRNPFASINMSFT